MTNIFNKTVLVKNGTLIGNWYEEDVLRDKTGEGRTIPGRHIPKKSIDLDKEKTGTVKRDETFSRTMGEKLETTWKTNNESFGKFVEVDKKYTRAGVKEKIFEDFFKAYVNNEKIEKTKLEASIDNIRLYDTTNRNIHITQSTDYGSIGKRHMMTQDNIPINSNNVDKLFMATHDMSKQPSILNQTQINGYADKFTPYYKDKEITYWSMNLNKGNIYNSSTLGENAFAKTSGFTQPIHNLKSVKQFNGNVTNSSTSKNIFLNNTDGEFSEKYRNAILQQNTPNDYFPEIHCKIMNSSMAKGWIGYRKLRIFLKNLSKRTSDVIDKSNFKYFFINFGIIFSEKEIDFIFNKFDTKRNNHINFNKLLDYFIMFDEERQNLVKSFYQQMKTIGSSFLSFKKLEKSFNPDAHPEAIYSNRSSPDIKFDYLTSWDNLKEDDIVTEDNLMKFFADASTCVESIDIFILCLKSCGMNI